MRASSGQPALAQVMVGMVTGLDSLTAMSPFLTLLSLRLPSRSAYGTTAVFTQATSKPQVLATMLVGRDCSLCLLMRDPDRPQPFSGCSPSPSGFLSRQHLCWRRLAVRPSCCSVAAPDVGTVELQAPMPRQGWIRPTIGVSGWCRRTAHVWLPGSK